MKPKTLLLLLLFAVLIFGLIVPNGIRAAITNNIWTISFIRQYSNNKDLDPQSFSPPSTHPHAGLLLANQAIKQDNVDLAWAHLAPLTASPDRLILETQASIHFLKGEHENAILIWKDLGRYSTLYTAASTLNSDDQLDAKILAYRSAYDIRGNPYDRLFTSSSMRKADLLLEEGQYDQAIAIYRALIDEFPLDARPYSGLARVYWLNNQPDLALATMEQGWDLNMGNPSYYITAARYYEELGLINEALDAYRTTLEINPDHHDALQAIERLKDIDE